MAKKQTKKNVIKVDQKGSDTKTKKKKKKSTPVSTPNPKYSFPEFPSAMDGTYQKIFKISAALMLLIMLACSQFVGIAADDKMQNEYEQELMNYYGSFGEDTGALNLEKPGMKEEDS